MSVPTTKQLSRLVAAGAISLVAVFGLAACNDSEGSGGDTVENEEMSDEPMEDEMEESDDMSEESMDEEPMEEEMEEEPMEEEMDGDMEDEG
ncbi:hypothetical protein ACFWTE_29315 [Nocardiopsis sp. NPDC058631]|uniref:hypothetical protein n=1 Tax=Nocardiopsis sp. NPDC058631 TaxID=3346566 RepID=UPI0036645D40